MTNNCNQKLQERHQKEGREKYRNLSEEEKDKRWRKFRERPWDQKNLVLNLIEKKIYFFYFPLCAGFLNQMGQNSDLTAFTSKDQVFPRPEWTKEGTPWKWILTIFKHENEYHK